MDEISAKYLYRLSYLANNFRDTFLRQVEQEFGLTRPEVTILFCLANRDGITAKDVSEVTRQPKNTLSRGAVILEDKGLITRTNDQKDRRRSLLKLTEKGCTFYDKVLPLYEQSERRMLAPLNEEELIQLDHLMARLCNHVADQNGAD